MITTPRLRLREIGADDLDFIAGLLGDPAVMRWFPKCFTRDEARRWVERQRQRYATHGYGYWLVRDRASGEPIGQAGLVPAKLDGREEPALGYILAPSWWGRGLATEAAAASCAHAFDRLRADRVVTLIRPENVPSQRVAERLGMWRGTTRMFGGYEHRVYRLPRADFVRPPGAP